MSLPRYPEMRQADTRLLVELPSGWSELPLKRIAEVIPSNVDKKSVEGEQRVRLCNYTDVYYNDRISAELPFMEATATSSQIQRLGLLAGDVIITKDSETADDIARAAYVPDTLPGVVCGYHLAVVRPSPSVLGEYLKYYFESRVTRAEVATLANGLTRVALGVGDIGNLTATLPPLPEQRGIVRFLNRETSAIDALIAEQERLIELLQEKRQAVISHAVTKGLNPNVPMKDSGIDWIGLIPASWDARPLRTLGLLKAGSGFPPDLQGEDGNELPFYKVNALGRTTDDGFLGETADTISQATAQLLRAFVFPKGTVAFAKVGAALLLSRFALTKTDCCLDNNMMGLVTDSHVDSSYAAYVLPLIPMSKIVNPGAVPSISESRIGGERVPLPTREEQLKILTFLREKLSELDTLAGDAHKLREVLRERRTALITAAVTGQIDVRGLVETAA